MTAYIPALSANNIPGYIASVISIPDLDREEEIELFKKYRKEGCVESAKKIILANLKLVVNLAYKFRRFRDAADLIQEGNTGLLTALKKFDIKKGVRFATYAAWWIKAKIQEFIISHMSIIRFGKGRDERKLFFNLVSTIKEIESYDSGREISRDELIEEVAKRLSLDPSRVRDSMKLLAISSDISLSETYDDDGHEKIELADEKSGFDTGMIEDDKRIAIENAIDSLNEREQFVIRSRYMSDEPLKLEEIGRKFSVSKERVRQIEERAIQKIREQAGIISA